MEHVVALDGALIIRTVDLVDPKGIFEFIWKEFCLPVEKAGYIPPLIFFIKKDTIEVFDFHPFTQSAQGKDIFLEMVAKRVEREIDIEGVALSAEAFIKIDRNEISGYEKEQNSVMLSLDWKGIGSTFARFAKKIEVDGGYKLVNVVNTDLIQGHFTNFFKQDQLQALKERINLQ